MTNKSFKKYDDAKEYASTLSKEVKREIGLLKTKEFNSTVFSVFILPKPENRRGYELLCEVVNP